MGVCERKCVMCVCVGGCVWAAGCDGMITLRPDGWVMRSAWETVLSSSLCSLTPSFKLKIPQDSGITLFNTHTTGGRICTEFDNKICASAAVSGLLFIT